MDSISVATFYMVIIIDVAMGQGMTGATGATGITGPPGFTGERGIMGATGPMGQRGVKGPPGLPGNAGIKGERGHPGMPGGPGFPGPSGPSGPAGPSGQPGERGPMGPSGPPGPSGLPGRANTCIGATGAMGPPGLSGKVERKGGPSKKKKFSVPAAASLAAAPGIAALVLGVFLMWKVNRLNKNIEDSNALNNGPMHNIQLQNLKVEMKDMRRTLDHLKDMHLKMMTEAQNQHNYDRLKGPTDEHYSTLPGDNFYLSILDDKQK